MPCAEAGNNRATQLKILNREQKDSGLMAISLRATPKAACGLQEGPGACAVHRIRAK
jgi:hypothetical protein